MDILASPHTKDALDRGSFARYYNPGRRILNFVSRDETISQVAKGQMSERKGRGQIQPLFLLLSTAGRRLCPTDTRTADMRMIAYLALPSTLVVVVNPTPTDSLLVPLI